MDEKKSLYVDRTLVVQVAKNVCPGATPELLERAIQFLAGDDDALIEADPPPRPSRIPGLSNRPILTKSAAIARIAIAYFNAKKQRKTN